MVCKKQRKVIRRYDITISTKVRTKMKFDTESRLRNLVSMARGGQDAGSRNLRSVQYATPARW